MTDALDLNNRVFCVRVKLKSATIDGFYSALLDFKSQAFRSPRHCFCSASDYAALSKESAEINSDPEPDPTKTLPKRPPRLAQLFGVHITEIAECDPGTVLFGFFDFGLGMVNLV